MNLLKIIVILETLPVQADIDAFSFFQFFIF
jgi:hypothetical protein